MSDPLVLPRVSLAHSDRVAELVVGVIGCALHCTAAILPSLRHAGLGLTAVCDLDLKRAERAMRLFGGQIAYPNLDDLVAREDARASAPVTPSPYGASDRWASVSFRHR